LRPEKRAPRPRTHAPPCQLEAPPAALRQQSRGGKRADPTRVNGGRIHRYRPGVRCATARPCGVRPTMYEPGRAPVNRWLTRWSYRPHYRQVSCVQITCIVPEHFTTACTHWRSTRGQSRVPGRPVHVRTRGRCMPLLGGMHASSPSLASNTLMIITVAGRDGVGSDRPAIYPTE
jgi:hypothetical protein